MEEIVGRKDIIEKLRDSLNENKFKFSAVYGRRRIGKTHLIRNYFSDKGLYLEFAGTKSGWDRPEQKLNGDLTNFFSELGAKFTVSQKELQNLATPKSWSEALELLKQAIIKQISIDPDEKIIIFFDEVPWLSEATSDFKVALERFINSEIKKYGQLKIFVCGSATAWMLKNIIEEKGSFYDRLDEKIHLRPFSLSESKEFLEKFKAAHFTEVEMTKLYMAIGGVAGYLNRVPKNSSVFKTTLRELIFREGSEMLGEYANLYQALFDDDINHRKIVEALGTASRELTKDELLEAAALNELSEEKKDEILSELVSSDIITKYSSYKNSSSQERYRISDLFSLFHLKWIVPLKDQYELWSSEAYWADEKTIDAFNSWKGYSFESICFLHRYSISKILKIDSLSNKFTAWSNKVTESEKKQGKRGCQIDMLIARSDDKFHIMEMKFYEQGVFSITREYKENLLNKRDRLCEIEKIEKNVVIFGTLTAVGAEDKTEKEKIHQHIKLRDLFEAGWPIK